MVVRLLDGTILKGRTPDFRPAESVFHLEIVDPDETTSDTRSIEMSDVGAIFFVRDFAFDRDDHLEEPLEEFRPPPSTPGTRHKVTMAWGEILEGITHGYEPSRPGFFLVPTAPEHHAYNLERVWITRGGVRGIERV